MFVKLFLVLNIVFVYVNSQQQPQPQQQHPLFRQQKPQQQQQSQQGNSLVQNGQVQQVPGQQFVLTQQQPPQQPQYINPQQFQFVPQQPPQPQYFDPNQQFVLAQQQPVAPQPQFVPQPQPQQAFFAQATPQQRPPQPVGPQINWGKCPQLEPSEKEKMAKATVITKCLETTALPTNITRETVELHREQIAACALQSEGWFTKEGSYDFNKAETEIKNKKLTKEIEEQVLTFHKQCKSEAEEKFPSVKKHLIAQIQLYQVSK